MRTERIQLLIFSILLLLASCSTVSRLPEGELLYTGTKRVVVTDDTPAPLRDEAVGEAKVAFVSPPNNALFGSSRYRTPLPIGLWAYNAFVDDSVGLRHWLFRTFAVQPILISAVNPELRTEVAENTLRNFGYFDSRVTYHTDTLADGRRARLSYTMLLGEAWRYGHVEYLSMAPGIAALLSAFLYFYLLLLDRKVILLMPNFRL